ncbi:MAG: hypothetical protein KKF68_03515 [Nanoarchaeota archaeon]|nr:hypothetical protein [Nanoarchaeota archaeon]
MRKKFLREVVIIVVGKQAEEIADLLDVNKHINEFLIAKKLDLTINQTRNILYKISDHGLVSFIRKKDKKKGWYTYFWKLEVIKCLDFLRNFLLKKIEQIKNQIRSRETKNFYICEKCNIEFNEENALLNDYTCNECGGIFSIKDNIKLLKELKKNLFRLEKELELVNDEIKIEEEKIEKKKLKEFKKEEKEKLKKKPLKKLAKKKLLKKKLVKKSIKKSVKKPFKRITKKIIKKKPIKKIAKKKLLKKKLFKKPLKKPIKRVTKKIVKKKPLKKPIKKKISKRKKR